MVASSWLAPPKSHAADAEVGQDDGGNGGRADGGRADDDRVGVVA